MKNSKRMVTIVCVSIIILVIAINFVVSICKVSQNSSLYVTKEEKAQIGIDVPSIQDVIEIGIQYH